MDYKYPVGPAIALSFAAAMCTFVVGFIIIFCWSLPAVNDTATPLKIWHYIWSEGFAFEGCGYDLSCRLHNFFVTLSDPQILRRQYLIGFACISSAIVGFLVMHWNAPRRELVRTIKGSKVLFDSDARRSLRKHIRKTGPANDSALWLMPRVQLTAEAEASNISVLGTHGSGKTAVLRGWIEQVIERGDKCVIHDAKGDLTASLPTDEFLLLAPRDARGWVWAIGRDVTDKDSAREVAANLVPRATTGESIWTDSARSILAGAIEVLQLQEKNLGDDAWGWQSLFKTIFLSPIELRTALMRIGSSVAILIEFDQDGGLTRTSQSILLTLWIAALTNIRPLADIEVATERSRKFSINEWLSQESKLPSIIILQHAADFPELTSTVSTLFIEVLAGKILSVSMPNRRTPWLYLLLDELSILKRIDRLPGLLNIGREKGVRCIAANQDWEQIIKLYGKEDAATLEARFTIKIVCKLSISDTRDRVIDKFSGQRDIVEWEDAGSNGKKLRRVRTVQVLEPKQISEELGVIGKADSLRVRLAIFGLGDVAMVDIPFTAWSTRRSAHMSVFSGGSKVK